MPMARNQHVQVILASFLFLLAVLARGGAIFSRPTICLSSTLVASLAVSGCSPFTSEPAAVSVCPPVKNYTTQWQDALALELPSLPAEAQQAIVDYEAERDRLRACHG